MIKTIIAILQAVKLKQKKVKWHLLQKQGKKVPMELKPPDFKSCTVYLL